MTPLLQRQLATRAKPHPGLPSTGRRIRDAGQLADWMLFMLSTLRTSFAAAWYSFDGGSDGLSAGDDCRPRVQPRGFAVLPLSVVRHRHWSTTHAWRSRLPDGHRRWIWPIVNSRLPVMGQHASTASAREPRWCCARVLQIREASDAGEDALVTYRVTSGVAMVTINRPQYRNAQN